METLLLASIASEKYHQGDRAQPESALKSTSSPDDLLTKLHDDLSRQYGSLLASADLVKVLGYRSSGAFRQAMVRGTVPVPLFTIPHRRGHFALALEVAAWMCRQRYDLATLPTRDANTSDIAQQGVTCARLAQGCTES